jgi:hydrogenase maturation protease
MTPVRMVVLACGNAARGDDGVGEAFLARAATTTTPPNLALAFVADYQFQPEHATDLAGRDLALFVDAAHGLDRACELREVQPAPGATFTTHGMTPAAVCDAYRKTYGSAPPPAFALAIRADACELGEPLSAAAREAVDSALAVFERLCESPSPSAWRTFARVPA